MSEHTGRYSVRRNEREQFQNNQSTDGYLQEENNLDSEKASRYVSELVSEKFSIDSQKLPNAARLVEEEISNVQTMGRKPIKYVDLYRDMPVKVTAKVLVPIQEFPKFNFVGKLLGPKGSTMKKLQEETMCKISVLGKGSMRNVQKEEECKASLDPKYSHLSESLHVKITALAKPVEAHARIAFALDEIKRYLVPDKNDEISREQSHQLRGMGGPMSDAQNNQGWNSRSNFGDPSEHNWKGYQRNQPSNPPRQHRVFHTPY